MKLMIKTIGLNMLVLFLTANIGYATEFKITPDNLSNTSRDQTPSEAGKARGAIQINNEKIRDLQEQAQQLIGKTIITRLFDAIGGIPTFMNARIVGMKTSAVKFAVKAASWNEKIEGQEEKAADNLAATSDILNIQKQAWSDAERPGFAGGMDALWAVVVDPDLYNRRQLNALESEQKSIGKIITRLQKEQSKAKESRDILNSDVDRLQKDADALSAKETPIEQRIANAQAHIAELQQKIDAENAKPAMRDELQIAIWKISIA